MEEFLSVMSIVYDLFNIPLNIYGFEFSLWQVLIFGLVVGIVFRFIAHLLYEN